MKTNKTTMLFLIIVLSLVLARYNLTLSTKNISDDVVTISTTTTSSVSITTISTTSKTTTKQTNSTTIKTTKQSKSTTTKNTSTTTKQKTTKKKVVSTKKEETVLKDYSKYGTVIKQIKITTYNVYSDGSTKEKNYVIKYKFDASNYSATTNDLLKEATSNASTYASKIKELVGYVNEYRKEANVSALTIDNNLNIAASIRALELGYANKFSHTRPNGSLCFTILKDLNISYVTAGENILAGYATPAAAAKGWKSSKDHYENMIDSSFKKTGIGLAIVPGSTYSYYWVQIFTA